MAWYTIDLSLETAYFYEEVARRSGRSVERELSDALFKLAGELSLEALANQKRNGG